MQLVVHRKRSSRLSQRPYANPLRAATQSSIGEAAGASCDNPACSSRLVPSWITPPRSLR
jgi:hypothetical protein